MFVIVDYFTNATSALKLVRLVKFILFPSEL